MIQETLTNLNRRLNAGAKDLKFEADLMVGLAQKKVVAMRIDQLLLKKDFGFDFTPEYYLKIHRFLFSDVYETAAGRFRWREIDYGHGLAANIGPWELKPIGPENLRGVLERALNQERQFCFGGIDPAELASHFAYLHGFLWITHFVSNGNTRTSTVFIINYLRELGYNLDNAYYMNNASYFKSALYRACMYFRRKGLAADSSYLVNFYRNVLLGEKNELNNDDIFKQ